MAIGEPILRSVEPICVCRYDTLDDGVILRIYTDCEVHSGREEILDDEEIDVH